MTAAEQPTELLRDQKGNCCISTFCPEICELNKICCDEFLSFVLLIA